MELLPHLPPATAGSYFWDVFLSREFGGYPELGTQVWLWPIKGLHLICTLEELDRWPLDPFHSHPVWVRHSCQFSSEHCHPEEEKLHFTSSECNLGESKAHWGRARAPSSFKVQKQSHCWRSTPCWQNGTCRLKGKGLGRLSIKTHKPWHQIALTSDILMN